MLWLIAGGFGGLVIFAARARAVVALMAEIADEQDDGATSSDNGSKSQRKRRRVSSA